MNKRSFNSFLRKITTKKLLDQDKIKNIDNDTLKSAVEYIVRNRGPVLANLIPATLDQAWLRSCGYLYQTVSKKTGFLFVHTCEHTIA